MYSPLFLRQRRDEGYNEPPCEEEGEMAKRILLSVGYAVIVFETIFYIRGGLLGLIVLLRLGDSVYNTTDLILLALQVTLVIFLPVQLFIINQKRRRLLIVTAVVFLVLLAWMVANAVATVVITADLGRILVNCLILAATVAAQTLALVYFIKSKYLKNRVAAYEERARQNVGSGRMLKPPL
jgi:hypothetical protein